MTKPLRLPSQANELIENVTNRISVNIKPLNLQCLIFNPFHLFINSWNYTANIYFTANISIIVNIQNIVLEYKKIHMRYSVVKSALFGRIKSPLDDLY